MAGDERRSDELAALVEPARAALEATHRAREQGLAACRRTIQSCGSAIRAIHRQQPDRVAELTAAAHDALREAQEALAPFPAVAHAGFLHDAEKEYAEAVLTAALVAGPSAAPLPDADAVGVSVVSWLKGLVEAASELRRHLLDRLREGETERAESLLGAMEDVYDMLVTIDYPDAVTAGLRRPVDALRAVLERSRADVTTSVMQLRLQRALEGRAGEG